ncbi:hypothetical protein MPTK1_8g18920 [Marchantia polymorpha subsp. ruderalis]|uniref:Uncharacterized protein n=1 Tax=Marchantia polymorpha TaxID=3197 RepID=A0A2R6W836_MARPO|nr:hypothetical protein MARPO_0131s0012 [Marchantia polymorpha]BBN20417.1 hypothetical protein Mp_8g18920 [Marchantia polymorpha subsp. ruderalis]|eukprot:PTQ30011.1 hypothetical protein MARPO_0131s0012 [Marchantia polymorpha]
MGNAGECEACQSHTKQQAERERCEVGSFTSPSFPGCRLSVILMTSRVRKMEVTFMVSGIQPVHILSFQVSTNSFFFSLSTHGDREAQAESGCTICKQKKTFA